MGSPNWNDLNICLTVARCGSLSAAGRQLGLSHSTILRRVAALEAAMGVSLFRKHAAGYEPNSAGLKLLEAAAEMEEIVNNVGSDIGGLDKNLSGIIRFVVPDLTALMVTSAIREFQSQYPDISFEFHLTQDSEGLTSGDAHLGLVFAKEPPSGLVGFRIGHVAFCGYANRQLVEDLGESNLPWVGFAQSLRYTPVGALQNKLSQNRKIIYRASTIAFHYHAVLHGLGAGLLPCGLGDIQSSLVRVGSPVLDNSRELWILYRPEMKNNARVQAFVASLKALLRAQAATLRGNLPSSQDDHESPDPSDSAA